MLYVPHRDDGLGLRKVNWSTGQGLSEEGTMKGTRGKGSRACLRSVLASITEHACIKGPFRLPHFGAPGESLYSRKFEDERGVLTGQASICTLDPYGICAPP
jgi:hypothetical protein